MLLPEPEAPTSATASPARRSKETPSTARTRRARRPQPETKVLPSPRTESKGAAAGTLVDSARGAAGASAVRRKAPISSRV